MANDIQIVVDSSDVQVLRRELLGVAKDAKSSASVFEREYTKVERTLNKNANSSQKYYSKLLGLDKATKDASQSASIFARELDKADKEVQAFDTSLDNLLRSIDPLKNMTTSYTQSLSTLDKALDMGKLSAAEYAQEVMKLKAMYQSAGLVFDKTGGIIQGSSKNMKMFRMQVQQTGYQVGDFFTQVAMGQNPLMAFATQATQLAGVFGGPWGAAIGAGISILGALGVAFMATGKEAKTFEDSLSEVQSAIGELNGSLEVLNTPMYELIQDMGLAAFQAKEMHRNLAQLVELRALENISNTSGVLKQNLEGLVDQLAVIQSPSVQGKEGWAVLAREAKALEEQFGVTVEEAKNINTALENLGTAKGPIQQAVAARQLADALMAARDDAGAVVSPLRAAAENALRLALEADKAAIAMKSVRDSEPGSGWLNTAIGKAATLASTLWDAAAAVAAAGGDVQVDASGNFPEGSGGRRPPRKAPSGVGGIDWGVDTGSKGGSKKKEQEDYLLSLLKEAEYKKSIIGLSEQEARRKEIIFQLTEKGLPIEDARIKKVLEAEDALKKATEAEDRRKSMLDRISSSMEEAFMSMVDGSKSVSDAFKGMLREILLDIYRQQVAKPISSGISDIIGSFLGGGSGGGTGSFGLPKPYADGGVVNRATPFTMTNGRAGVMGEAGPEAIMPLKRGKNGQLGVQMNGESGSVVVNQNFNFSANGDESVKKIIAQAAPQIAMMTQKQIMDSRRRGGSMKATFG